MPLGMCEYLAQVLPNSALDPFAVALGNEGHMVFALPLAVSLTLILVHLETPPRVLGGSRSAVSWMDSCKCQTLTATAAGLGASHV